jgi:membrane protein implicated in regulation of membrane protease activity
VHVLCCGLPLLIAAGAFTGLGAVLGNGLLFAVGSAILAVALAAAVRRARRGSDAQCCPSSARPQDVTASGRR